MLYNAITENPKLTTYLGRTCSGREISYFSLACKFNSTLNFTQSGWPILFNPDLSFPASKLGKLPNPLSLGNAVQCRRHTGRSSITFSLAGQRHPVQMSHCGSRIAAAAAWTHKGTQLIYGFLARNPSWI